MTYNSAGIHMQSALSDNLSKLKYHKGQRTSIRVPSKVCYQTKFSKCKGLIVFLLTAQGPRIEKNLMQCKTTSSLANG